MAHHVFISYSHENKSIADQICAALEAEHICCWVAPRDVTPGKNWSGEIMNAVKAGKVFVLVYSSHSNISQHVLSETEKAMNCRIPIIPFRIEDVPLTADMEYYIGRCQWLDALTPPLKMHLQKLCQAVKSLLPINISAQRDEDNTHISSKTNETNPTESPNHIKTTYRETPSQTNEPISNKKINFKARVFAIVGITLISAGSFLLIFNRLNLNKVEYKFSYSLSGHNDNVESVAFSPDGRYIVSGSDDHTIKIWSVDGKVLHTLGGDKTTINCVSYSPDGQRIASGSWDSTIKIWSTNGMLLQTLYGHKDCVWSVTFSPDGKRIVSGSYDKTIKVWSIGGKVLHTLSGHKDTVYCVSFSPDGQRIVSGSWDNTIKIWSIDGMLLHTLSGYKEAIEDVVFSPDGQRIVSGSDDGIIKLWSVDGTLIRTWRGAYQFITSVAFSPDGQRIVSGSADNRVKVWDANGSIKQTLSGHTGTVRCVAFSPDGQLIISGADDGLIKVWRKVD